MSDKEEEFNDFIEAYKRIPEGSADKTLDEMNTNYQKYKIRETNTTRNEIEYFTHLNYKNKTECFCDKSKTIYFYLINVQEDAEYYSRVVYVCDPFNKYRIYHTYTPK